MSTPPAAAQEPRRDDHEADQPFIAAIRYLVELGRRRRARPTDPDANQPD